MKILFIDSYTCDYDTTTYMKRPLGGTQSAVAHLSKALVEAGHEVTVINGVADPVETDGVRFMHLPCPSDVLNSFDVVVPVSAILGKTLRSVGCTRPIVLWCHHAADQPAVQQLRDPSERAEFAGYAFVSKWQAESYMATFGVKADAIRVMRNAVPPPFLTNTARPKWFKTGAAPVLGYSSTPYRGLDILLLSFASIRRQIEGATLRIFSSMGIYGPDVKDEYSSLYDLARTLPGVTYVGPLPQPQLAEAMADIDIWSYPCSFAETSCISAMEAMASGTVLVSTTLGALPETTAGFAHLSDFSAPHTPGMGATRFASHVVQAAATAKENPNLTEAALAKQVEFTRANYNWNTRALEWIEWLKQIK